MYASTHLISSKRLTEYTDFPMPEEFPPYPSHRQALDYLRSYARHFQLYDSISFGNEVARIEPEDDRFRVWITGEARPRRYRGVVIANGHHWDPLLPELPGEFHGEVLHSHHYKTPEVLQGRRVLVVGAGNSGCDIAVEAAQHAAAAFHSLRRGYHFLPKFLRGMPVDELDHNLQRMRLPLWLRRFIAGWVVYYTLGPPEKFGLPRPTHRLFEAHPIVNSQLLYFLGHGRILPKPDVARLAGREVEFADGSREAIDLIVFATGFRLSFPFLEGRHLNMENGVPRLFLNAFHPQHDHLFIAGLTQPNSGQWGLTDLQTQLFARFLVACRTDEPRAAWFRELKSKPTGDLMGGIRMIDSPRHALEVDSYRFRRRLEHLIARFPQTALAPRR